MTEVTVDGVSYDFDALSEHAKQQLLSLQVTDAEIQRLQSLIAITQTARNAYLTELKAALPKTHQ